MIYDTMTKATIAIMFVSVLVLFSTGCDTIEPAEYSPVFCSVVVDTVTYMGSSIDDPDLDIHNPKTKEYVWGDYGDTLRIKAGLVALTCFEYVSLDSIINRTIWLNIQSDTTILIERKYQR